MIKYSETKVGDILKVAGPVDRGFADKGDLIEVIEVGPDYVRTINYKTHKRARFSNFGGAKRLKKTGYLK